MPKSYLYIPETFLSSQSSLSLVREKITIRLLARPHESTKNLLVWRGLAAVIVPRISVDFVCSNQQHRHRSSWPSFRGILICLSSTKLKMTAGAFSTFTRLRKTVFSGSKRATRSTACLLPSSRRPTTRKKLRAKLGCFENTGTSNIFLCMHKYIY